MYNNKSTVFKTTSCLSRDQLVKYHQNQLTAVEKHAVEEHLIDCELCSEALEGIALLTSYVIMDNTTEEVKRKYTSIAKSDKTKERPVSNVIWYAAASVLLIAVLSWVLNNNVQKDVMHISNFTQQTPTVSSQGPAVASDAAHEKEEKKTETIHSPAPVEVISSLAKKNESTIFASATQGSIANNNAPAVGEVQYDLEAKTENREMEVQNTSYKNLRAKADVQASAASGSEYSAPAKTVTEDMTKNMEGYKMYNYRNEYAPAKRNALEKNGVPARYESKDEMAKASTWNNIQAKEISYDDFLSDALNDYKTKKYASALNKFQLILADHPADVNALFYAALASHESGNAQKALSYLDQLDALPNETFKQESEWHRALILLTTSQKDKGIVLLKRIADAEGFYAKQAVQKLDKIKDN
jgi:hypothetical protein